MPSTPVPGDRVGRWTVGDPLGVGASGTVFTCLDDVGRVGALKTPGHGAEALLDVHEPTVRAYASRSNVFTAISERLRLLHAQGRDLTALAAETRGLAHELGGEDREFILRDLATILGAAGQDGG